VKLSLELSKRDTGRTLYILDEPTTGLHFHDIELLLKVIQKLRDHGNTVVIIEHNLDVIKTADWLIDMGPEGGAGGGQVIAKGTPETVAASKASFTGKYLAPLLKRKVARRRRGARRAPPSAIPAALAPRCRTFSSGSSFIRLRFIIPPAPAPDTRWRRTAN
jgi:ABC-type glutathione transport system ATPase component